MKTLFETLHRVLSEGKDAVLVTVVASDGAAPRGSGARMLVTADGRLCGTVGGGAVEYRCEHMAADLLQTKENRMESFRLHPNEVADLGMICGGNVDIYFRFIPGGDAEAIALTEKIAAFYTAGEQFWLVCSLKTGALSVYGAQSGAFGAAFPAELIPKLGSRPAQLQAEDETFYCELILHPGHVYVFGGGHVAQALVPVLAGVAFRCVVLEDRPDFLRKELFPQAEETVLYTQETLPEIVKRIGPADCVCIMTRGHKDDLDVQRHVMKTGAKYIGVIGSAAKQRTVKAKLLDLGFTEADFANVVSPIGLDIGGQTPAEIAVSIAAQLIAVRAGKGSGPVWESIK